MIVFVGIPVIDGKPSAATVDSLLAEQLIAVKREGVYLYVNFLCGCSLIGHARNQMAQMFLASECDVMVFIDADMSWNPGELVKLSKRPEDVIGGTYRTKQDKVRFNVHKPIERDGDLYRVGGVPTGFLKITRKAFEKIAAPAYHGSDGILHEYFPTGLHEGTMYGEDYGFCRLWREAGGDVWLDPSIRLRHHDGFRYFDGDPAEWLESHD